MSSNRILIIDGSAVSRRIASRVLEEAMPDVEVIVCGTGMEAAELIGREEAFSMIACSQMLPDMDGLKLCRSVRSSQNNCYTPFVIISSDVDSTVMRDGYAAGVTDYFDRSMGYKAFGDFIKLYCQISTGSVGSVMYVEDSLTAATMTKRTLARHGIQVTHFTNVEDALVYLDRVVKSL